jgi:serine/threonine protein kinase
MEHSSDQSRKLSYHPEQEKVIGPANSPTLTISPTRAGMILGTAAYMSPEQARGKAVDKRADIWAFGVVLFEMLTGKKLFDGETVSDTLAQVLTKEPDWEQVPAQARKLVRRCLERDPKLRLRDIGDAKLLLEEAPEEMASAKRRPLVEDRGHGSARSRSDWRMGDGAFPQTASRSTGDAFSDRTA